MEWQPIKTAPKDGTNILGWDKILFVVVVWWDLFEDKWNVSFSRENALDLTHWMPLPGPPRN